MPLKIRSAISDIIVECTLKTCKHQSYH